jgi:hypothetical protein
VLAKETCPTRDGKRHNYPIAFAQIVPIAPGFFDNTHELMAHDHVFQLWEETVVDVQVRAADRGRGDSHNDVLRILYFGVINVVYFDVTRSMINHGLHVMLF